MANLEQFTKLHEERENRWTGPEDRSRKALNIHTELSQHRAKDLDQVSVASSTHFTVVNGFGQANARPKSSSVCSPGRQITILITIMSVLFAIVIIGMIYLMDREYPQPRTSSRLNKLFSPPQDAPGPCPPSTSDPLAPFI